MKRLSALFILLSLVFGLVACGTQDEPRKNRKEEYPIVMVNFLSGTDFDGDPNFFVYRCKYCFGEKDDLAKQQESLLQNKNEVISILKSNKLKQKGEEERFERLVRDQIAMARIIGKMQYARRKFLEEEGDRLKKLEENN